MKLPNSMPSQINARIVEIEYTLQLEITCFQVVKNERITLKINKEHVKIIFIPVIALSYSSFAPNWNRLCTNMKNSIPDMLVYFFLKRCIEIPKNAILCARVVSGQLCNVNGPRAQVQHDELVKRLSFGETVEFLRAEVFVL